MISTLPLAAILVVLTGGWLATVLLFELRSEKTCTTATTSVEYVTVAPQATIDAGFVLPHVVTQTLSDVYNIQTNAHSPRFMGDTYQYGLADTAAVTRQPYEETFRRFHREILQNHPHHDGQLVLGLGSTQLMHALVYALEKNHGSLRFYQKQPCYPLNELAINRTARQSTFLDTIPADASQLVEVITTPNNPDGELRRPETNASIVIVDLSYMVSSFLDAETIAAELEWMRSYPGVLIAICSVSKALGMPGHRVGYTFLSEQALYLWPALGQYMEDMTAGYTVFGLADAEMVIRASLEDPSQWQLMSSSIRTILNRRYDRMRPVLEALQAEVISPRGMPFVYARMPYNQAAEMFLTQYNTIVYSGEHFGGTSDHVRISLGLHNIDFEALLTRLSA